MSRYVQASLEDRNIEPELVCLLYGSRLPSVAALALGLGTCLTLWADLPPQLVLGWGTMLVVAHGLRMWMQYVFSHDHEDSLQAARWLRRYACTSLLIGLSWAALAIPLARGISGAPFFAICAAAILMQAANVLINNAYLPSFAAVAWPIGVSITAALAWRGEVDQSAFAMFFLIVTGCAQLFAQRLSATLRESLLSRHERLTLAADLSARNAELAQANERLGAVNVQLQETQAIAEAANKAKSEFLSNMSHELRTPLNAIIGFSEIIKDQAFGPVTQPRYIEYANDIYESGRSLLQLINDILDLSKVEAGKMELQRTFVDVGDTLSRCLRLIKERASKSRVQLETAFHPSVPLLFADEVRLRQIVLNLLSNAVKFTPAGGKIKISTSVDPSGAIAITVADTGIGMSAADIKIALERFGQAVSSLSRPYEGTGLGLPLTKAMVELHGGRLDITSAPGKGTRVTVTFPPQRFPEASAHAAD